MPRSSWLGRRWQYLRRYGPGETGALVWENVLHLFDPGRAAAFKAKRALHESLTFDRLHGTDTVGAPNRGASLADADPIEGVEVAGTYLYLPTFADDFYRMMDRLPVDPSTLTFVDYGSGKGKVLLLASHLPFRRVIGIEFMRQLHETAVANLARYRNDAVRCTDVQVVCADATSYRLPLGELVVFLFDPFSADVLSRTVAQIVASWAERPRTIFVAYLRMDDPAVFLDTGVFDLVDTLELRQGRFCLFRTRSGGRPSDDSHRAGERNSGSSRPSPDR
jgi:hypothetical protein